MARTHMPALDSLLAEPFSVRVHRFERERPGLAKTLRALNSPGFRVVLSQHDTDLLCCTIVRYDCSGANIRSFRFHAADPEEAVLAEYEKTIAMEEGSYVTLH